MALIKCAECGNEISDSAERCPHCGCKTKLGETLGETAAKRKSLVANVIITLIFAVIGAIMFFTALSDLQNISSYYWRSGRWVEEPEAVWAVCKVIGGPIILICCAYDMYKIKKKAEELN